jgi:formiminoglutamase
MSGESLNGGEWYTQLEPSPPPEYLFHRADDLRLGDIVEYWRGNAPNCRRGQAVIVGFPQDEGVRRNHGRPGAAQAPHEIRQCLYRLTPWDAENNIDLTDYHPLDIGDVRLGANMEESQAALGQAVDGILSQGAVPVILGGGHETAYGHYLGYVAGSRPVGIINIDAHLDVRPCLSGRRGHSGSPFRQALEHPAHPLPGKHYICLGAQPHTVSRAHWQYARERGATVRWCHELKNSLEQQFLWEIDQLASTGSKVYVSLDADVIQLADVPGVSAPNPVGLTGAAVVSLARQAGKSPWVSSFDLVEISPPCDINGQSSRWAALVLWNFLIGMALRERKNKGGGEMR